MINLCIRKTVMDDTSSLLQLMNTRNIVKMLYKMSKCYILCSKSVQTYASIILPGGWFFCCDFRIVLKSKLQRKSKDVLNKMSTRHNLLQERSACQDHPNTRSSRIFLFAYHCDALRISRTPLLNKNETIQHVNTFISKC